MYDYEKAMKGEQHECAKANKKREKLMVFLRNSEFFNQQLFEEHPVKVRIDSDSNDTTISIILPNSK